VGLVIGTNCGFVSSRPTSDPTATYHYTIDGMSRTTKFTSPSEAIKVTEMGCYIATESGLSKNCQIAVYDHDSGNNRPGNIVGAKGYFNVNDPGWHFVTGLDISIVENTTYWLAFQMDAAFGTSSLDTESGAYNGGSKSAQTTLLDPFGTMTGTTLLHAIYALYETGETNTQINIGDVWKKIAGIQINIGDAWKVVAGAQINIGDAWKELF